MVIFFYPRFRENNNAYLKRQLLKITKVTSVAIVIYLVYSFLKGEMTISSLVSIKRWGLLFLFNVSTVGVHLWYLLAYIYVLLIVYFVKKSQISDFQIFIMGGVILCLTPIIALLCSFGGIPVVLYRNWLFTGIPFFVLGMYIYKMDLENKINVCFLEIGILLFSVLSILDGIFLNDQRDLLFTTPLLSFCVFLLFLKKKEWNIVWMSEIGKRDSLWIYIFHYMIISIIRSLYSYWDFNMEGTAFFLVPIVMLVSMGLSRLVQKIKLFQI